MTPAARILRNLDSRLIELAHHNTSIKRLVDIASDPSAPGRERDEAIRTLQAFLVFTPSAAEGWHMDLNAPAEPGWRRDDTETPVSSGKGKADHFGYQGWPFPSFNLNRRFAY